MENNSKTGAFILGLFLFAGLTVLGYQLADGAIQYRQLDRSVTVKGLSEREFEADVAIWPIEFTLADNDLETLYVSIESQASRIKLFLEENGFTADEITSSSPAIKDKSAEQYGNNYRAEFRYSALQSVTVYTNKIESVRRVKGLLSELGKQGIVFTGPNYQSQTEYIFTRLNDIKPEMIEEATRKAREVAEKFASDSQSSLGKIKRASQGQFSINARDKKQSAYQENTSGVYSGILPFRLVTPINNLAISGGLMARLPESGSVCLAIATVNPFHAAGLYPRR